MRFKEPIVGFAGNGTLDIYLPAAQVRAFGNEVVVRCGPRAFELHCTETVRPGGKLIVPSMPMEMAEYARVKNPGGGALNSLVAFSRITHALQTRYLDACKPDKSLMRVLAAARAQARFLSARVVPTNFVVGDRTDKIVFKSPAFPLLSLTPSQRRAVNWICASDVVLASSLKDESVMESILAKRRAGRIRLYAVLTGSLSRRFVEERVLDVADVICASWDELPELTGATGDWSVSALISLRWLQAHAPRALVFITLGKHGVLAAGPDGAWRVSLKTEIAARVDSVVLRDPAVVCGCGDAFASGAMAALDCGTWLLAEPIFGVGQTVAGALAGCASALRRLHFNETLSVAAFSVCPPSARSALSVAV